MNLDQMIEALTHPGLSRAKPARVNKDFVYATAAESVRPGYLREKFLAMNPACFDPPRPREPGQERQ